MGYFFPGVPLLGGASTTLGASAAICGLVGALLHYGNRGGSSMIRSHAISCIVTIFISGLLIARVDNYAHAGGFLGGYVTSIWLDPLKPERVDHMVIAVICVFATALSIVASIVTTLPLLRFR
jgi:rhomboid protease GluP